MNKIKIYHWLPRILCMLAILFVSVFALDSFRSGETFWTQISEFSIHLIPTFVLLAILLFAWKKELSGGIIFILTGVVLSPFVYNMNYRMNNSVWMSLGIILSITIPFIVVGILFIISYLKKRNVSI